MENTNNKRTIPRMSSKPELDLVEVGLCLREFYDGAQLYKTINNMDDDLKKLRDRDIFISGHSELLFRESIESADSTDLSDLPDLEIVPEDSEVYHPSSDQRRGVLFLEDSRLFIPSSASVQGDPFCQGIFPRNYN